MALRCGELARVYAPAVAHGRTGYGDALDQITAAVVAARDAEPPFGPLCELGQRDRLICAGRIADRAMRDLDAMLLLYEREGAQGLRRAAKGGAA